MSAPGTPPAPAIDTRMQTSHQVRSGFERWALIAFIVIIVAVCLVALLGALMPPAKPVLTNITVSDWGATIVARVVQLKDTILDMLGALLSGVGVTLTRGHMDARLDTQRGDS